MSYTESDEYQKEIANQYQKRTVSFELAEVVKVMKQLGFNVSKKDLSLAEGGNMNATFLTSDYVIKINNEKEPRYLANTVVSENLSRKVSVVTVLKYDNRDETDYEVLVMERARGNLWQDTITEQDDETRKKLFCQVLEVINKASTLKSDRFGSVSDPQEFSYSILLEGELREYGQIIKDKKLANSEDINHITSYVKRHLAVFENETPVLVHQDLHMGNVLHDKVSVTAVIDWDGASYLPKFLGLVPLLGLINDPGQFVEGTPDYPRFKGRQFLDLLPMLKSELSDVFIDKDLMLKLNVVSVVLGLMWVSQDWSKEWNKEMIENLVKNETPNDLLKLKSSYYGKLLL